MVDEAFSYARVVGRDFSGLKLGRFHSHASVFVGCSFDRVQVKQFFAGAGWERSVFVDCSFEGARLRFAPGGFARFERCSFLGAQIVDWLADPCDLVECNFGAVIRRSIFLGAPYPDKRERLEALGGVVPLVSEVRGNDFSAARLDGVSFRRGLVLSDQLLPTGPDYHFVADLPAALAKAAPIVAGWPDPKRGRIWLEIWQEDVERGQREDLLQRSLLKELWEPMVAAMEGRAG